MSQTNILLETGTNEVEIVEFYVNQDGYEAHYGLNVAKVVEIGRRYPVTSLPEMCHPAVLGAFAHRNGHVIPLIDMALFMGSSPIVNADAKVIVTEFNTICNAFLVSGVNRIHRMSWNDVEAPGKLVLESSRNSVTGVIRLGGRVVFILDLESIVAEMYPGMSIRFETSETEEALPVHKTYNILHADDSNSIRSIVRNLLTKDGRFTLHQVCNGQEAWDYLLELRAKCHEENRPISDFVQGVISDIEMPTMDGLALCRQIKEDSTLKELPVAIFSSLITDSVAKKCATVGANAQFAKPELMALSVHLYEMIEQTWG